jgi:hypothetical protein
MSALLDTIRDLIQRDVNNRGLARDPAANLLTACAGDFVTACRSIAQAPQPALAVVTGFWIPQATPPAAETDGPLGALFLARALTPLGVKITLVTDSFCRRALESGLEACGLGDTVRVITLPPATHPWPVFLDLDWRPFTQQGLYRENVREGIALTHLIALERVGPNREGRCRNMRGLDITDHTAPAHRVFEDAARRTPPLATIGIGDGGNEIGMGKVPAEVIGRNIPNGDLIACRVPVDHLIVAGISNWGAYGLAAGVALLRGRRLDRGVLDVDRERELLQVMVEKGPLVDGVTGRQTLSVDGLSFEEYAEPLRQLRKLLEVGA